MFGTTLATAPIMASNFIGTRVFTLGLYTDMFVDDLFQFTQNHLFNGNQLNIDPTTTSSTTITQVHVLDDIGLVAQPEVQSTTISQLQFMVPLGVYLNTFVSQTSIAQNHVVAGLNLKSDTFTASANFTQRHNLNFNGLLSDYDVTSTQMNQNHVMVSLGSFTSFTVEDNMPFSQQHVLESLGSYLDTFTEANDNFRQQHIMTSTGLVLDPVKVGMPYVNPSQRRVVNATADSTNVMLITANKENSVLILNPLTNKYS